MCVVIRDIDEYNYKVYKLRWDRGMVNSVNQRTQMKHGGTHVPHQIIDENLRWARIMA